MACVDEPFVPYVEYLNRLYNNKNIQGYAKNDVSDAANPAMAQALRGKEGSGGGAGGGAIPTVMLDPFTVHAFFDRMQHALPEYVGMMPAIKIGVLVAVAIAGIGSGFAAVERLKIQKAAAARKEAAQQRDATPSTSAAADLTHDMVELGQKCMDARWILYILISLWLAATVAKVVIARVYGILLLSKCKNQKHFAAMQFAKLYKDAVKGGL